MSDWTAAELDRIGRADELEVASMGRDGKLTGPVTIWMVRDGNDVYVRSAVKGPAASWYRATKHRHQGHISAGGISKDVTFVDTPNERADEIDAAYRKKYARYGRSIVDSCLTQDAKATTIRLVPR